MRTLKPHSFMLLLIASICLGVLTGLFLGPSASKLKPLGDLFLNLIFTSVVPLIFFSIASAIAEIRHSQTLLKLTLTMFLTFISTSLIAAIYMLVCVKLFPLAENLNIPLGLISIPHQPSSLSDQIVSMLSVSNFIQLFSRDNMLALIIFSALLGLATAHAQEKGTLIAKFLLSGRDVSMKLVSLIMMIAPLGFFAFFANLISSIGTNLLHAYLHVTLVYYLSALIFFVFSSSIYAFIAGRWQCVKNFWGNIFLPATTAFATCSSAASIPANLKAAEAMGVPKHIAELSIPLGGVLHKDGSVLGGMVKIAFLFGLFHWNFFGPATFLTAIIVSILVGTVMGAIPSGGMIGEMLIISAYGFPPQALMIIAVISMIIDPPATLISVTSNTACSLLITRGLRKKKILNFCAR